MDLESLKGAAEGLVNQAKEAVTSEEQTDGLLDKAAQAVSDLTGGKFDEQIDGAREFLDSKLGE